MVHRRKPSIDQTGVLAEVPVPWIARMQFISTLATQADGHFFCHLLEQRLEKQHRDIEVFAVPGEIREPFVERIGFQNVLMVLEIQ